MIDVSDMPNLPLMPPEVASEFFKGYVNNGETLRSGVNIIAFISLAFKIEPSNDLSFTIVPSCSPICFILISLVLMIEGRSELIKPLFL